MNQPNQATVHYQHKLKCLHCNLHFIVLSYWPIWPNHPNDAVQNKPVYCPECGKDGYRLAFIEASDRQIHEMVPGRNAKPNDTQMRLPV